MLVLTRKLGEKLMIGDDIQIRVLGISGNQLRFGIEAPKHVAVHREEIYNKIQEEKQTQQQEESVVTEESLTLGVNPVIAISG